MANSVGSIPIFAGIPLVCYLSLVSKQNRYLTAIPIVTTSKLLTSLSIVLRRRIVLYFHNRSHHYDILLMIPTYPNHCPDHVALLSVPTQILFRSTQRCAQFRRSAGELTGDRATHAAVGAWVVATQPSCQSALYFLNH